jgi:hypothetical protein
MMLVSPRYETQTCRFVPICDEGAQIGHVPVTYVAGRDTSVPVVEHADNLVSWYGVRVNGHQRLTTTNHGDCVHQAGCRRNEIDAQLDERVEPFRVCPADGSS